MLVLDHIAIGAEALAPGAEAFEAATGTALVASGVHPAMGTHNRLASLGPDEYLEVIAIDPDAPAPDQPRWFGLSDFTGPPRGAAWIARTDDLDAAVAAAPPGMGALWSLSRDDLAWRITVPETGYTPFGGLFPALIQWEGRAHPAPNLTDTGLRLLELCLTSPDAAALSAALTPMINDPRLRIVPGPAPAMTVTLATPSGKVTL